MVLITILKFLTDVLVWYILAGFLKTYFELPVSFAVLMIPAAIYLLWMVHGKYFGAQYDRQVEKCRRVSLLFGILLFLTLFKLGDGAGTFLLLFRQLMPLVMLYYLMQILLFRILRQDPAVYSEKRFQISNLLLMGGIALAVWLLGSANVLYGISKLLYLFWTGPVTAVLRAVLWVFSYTVGFIIYGIVTILIRLFGDRETPPQSPEELPQPQDPAAFAEYVNTAVPSWLTAAAAALALLLAGWLILRVFLMLADRTGMKRSSKETGETRSRISRVSGKSLRERALEYFTPQGRIRRRFRHFIRTVREREKEALSGQTGGIPENCLSTDVADAAITLFPAKKEEILELSMIYRRARYEDRENPVTADDAVRADMLEKSIYLE